MTEAFYWFLNMQIVASLCAIIILALRKFTRLPRRLICWLWLIPALRALIPWGIGNRWGSFGLVGLISRVWGRNAVISGVPDALFSNYVQIAEAYNPLTFASSWQEKLFATCGLVWIIGAAALLLAFIILYATTLWELKDAKPLSGQAGVYTSEKISGPALYGMIRPRILLPAGKEGDPALPYILLHERTHLSRRDNLRRMPAFFLAALCWFNPLAWLCLKRFLEDLELACDEQVLQSLGEERKKDYARALVSQAEQKYVFVSAFGGAAVRLRVERILSWRHIGLLAWLALGAFALVLTWFLLVNPIGGVR